MRFPKFACKLLMAERGGFEPPVQFLTVRRFSKPLLSTTQPPLLAAGRASVPGTVWSPDNIAHSVQNPRAPEDIGERLLESITCSGGGAMPRG